MNISQLDASLLLYINQFSTPLLDSLFLFITNLGGFVAVSAAVVLIALYLIIKRQYVKSGFIVASVGGAAILNIALKSIFERPRPDLWEQLVNEQSYSFPSGHAMASLALAASAVLLLWQTRWRMPAVILGSVYVLLVGFSRMYLGVHYLTDVLAGWVISLAWAGLVYWLVGSHRDRYRGSETRL